MKKRGLSLLLTVTLLLSLLSPLGSLQASAAEADITLFAGDRAACLYVDTDTQGKTELKQVVRAAGDLQEDFAAVTGASLQAVAEKTEISGTAILVGTLGHSDLIDALVESEKLDTDGVAGEVEAFTIQIVEAPFDGCDCALVIAGSDKRGTIYGIYTLSEKIGVSPWYWWGDVPIVQKSVLSFTKAEIETTEKPDVLFRGIFINDEKNLTNWSAGFQSATSPGTPNPDMYEKVFELLLRLKANTLWPAMHNYSTGFNSKLNPATGQPYNAERADEYGIIMGASHCEILLRNNEAEWTPWCEQNKGKYNLQKVNNDWHQSYDYTVNAEAMNVYWRERVAANYKYDNLYTIGLRGVHDSGIQCKNLANPTYENKAKVVKQAVEAQIAILEEYEQKYYEETGERKIFPKVYCPYKEAAEYFKYDLSLPSDTYILWADDNYGYLRAVSNQSHLDSYQGGGVYYHISYWGRPISTLWVATTPLTQMYEELRKSYDSGSGDVFILNVGDIKPGELPITFFMDMSWDIDRYNENTVDAFVESFAKQNLGLDAVKAAELADILNDFYQTTIAKRPEFQGSNRGNEFSLVNYGDEAQQAIQTMVELCDRSQAILDSLDATRQASYYQMVQYMLRVSRYSFEKSYYQQKNQLAYKQGRFAAVNAYAKASADAYAQLLEDVTYYNQQMSDGKWNKILNPYVSGIPQPAGELNLSYVDEFRAADGVGSVCEGQTNGTEAVTLDFHSLTDDRRFIDVFNKGMQTAEYKIVTDPQIKIITTGDTVLKQKTENGKYVYTGSVEVEDRVWAVVDWDQVEVGKQTASISVSDAFGEEKTYTASIVKTTVDPQAEFASHNGYYETNGEVSIEAEHYSDNVAVDGQFWKRMPGLGRSGDSMKVYPELSAATNVSRIDTDFETKSPYLAYEVYFETTGDFIPTLYRLPTLNEGDGLTCRTAIQLDDGEIGLFKGRSYADDADASSWAINILNGIEMLTLTETPIKVTTPGWHTIKLYKSDAGIVVDKLVLRNAAQAEKKSHLGAPESFNTITAYTQPPLVKAPTFALSEVTYPTASETKFYYDFTDNETNVSAGYIAIDNKLQSAALKGYNWDTDGFAAIQTATRSMEKVSLRDRSILYSAENAGIQFKMPEAGTYLVSLAIGDRSTSGVAVSDMEVTANGVSVLKDYSLARGRTVEKAFFVTVTEDKIIDLKLSGNWVLAAAEITLYQPGEANDGHTYFIPDEKGDVRIEAETALENSEYAYCVTGTDSAKSTWEMTSGHSGAGMFSGPNMDGNFTNTSMSVNKGAKMRYQIEVEKTGTYVVWALAKSQNSDDDSLLFAMDNGAAIAVNDFHDTAGEFVWLRVGTLRISAAGVHTLTVSEREDGSVLDKIVLVRSGIQPTGTGGTMLRASHTKPQTPSDPSTDKPTDETPTPSPNTPVTPQNGTIKVGGKLVLLQSGKRVVGTKVVTVFGKTYAVVNGYVSVGKGNHVVKISASKSYIVNKNGMVVKGSKNKLIKVSRTKSYVVNSKGVILKNNKKNKLVKVGKKSYIVNKKGVVQKNNKKNKLVRIGKKAYIVNKSGVVQKSKKKINVGKVTYKTNKSGVANKKK